MGAAAVPLGEREDVAQDRPSLEKLMGATADTCGKGSLAKHQGVGSCEQGRRGGRSRVSLAAATAG